MKKINIVLLLGFFCFFLSPVYGSARVDYPFEKKIVLPQINTPQKVYFSFDEEVLSQMNMNFRNFHIYDDENNPVDFDFYYEPGGVIEKPQVLEVSSTREGKTSFLVDDNSLTSYAFELEDGTRDNPARVLLDLQSLHKITRISLFDTAGPRMKEVQVRAGTRRDHLRTILSQRPYHYKYDVITSPLRYLEIFLWGRGIVVDDIRIYAFPQGQVSFEAQPGKRYSLLFGDPTLEDITFKNRSTSPFSGKEVSLSPQSWNPLFPEDKDLDGLLNEEDNCFLIPNPDQKDSDEDGVGDVCDNAPHHKNASQEDSDFDGVGDIIDNCPLIPNPDQKDRNDNGQGDACDNSIASGDSSFQISPLTFSLLGLLIMIIFFFFRIKGMKEKSSL